MPINAQRLANPEPTAQLIQDNNMSRGFATGATQSLKWMEDAPENPAMIKDELPEIIDWERTIMQNLDSREGGNVARGWQNTKLVFGNMVAGMAFTETTGTLDRSSTKLDNLTLAIRAQAAGEEIDYNDLNLPSGGHDRRNDIASIERFLSSAPEERTRIMRELSVEVLSDEVSAGRYYTKLRELAAERERVNFTAVQDLRDIRSAGDLMEWGVVQGVPSLGIMAGIIGAGVLTGGVGGVAIAVGGGAAVAQGEIVAGQVENLDSMVMYTPEMRQRARTTAMISGAFEAVLGPTSRISALGVRSLFNAATRREALSALSEPVLRRVSQGYLRRIGAPFLRDGVEEFVAEGFQTLIEQYGVEGELTLDDETLWAALNGAVLGGMTGGAIGMGIGARGAIRDERTARAMADAGQTVQTMDQLAAVTQRLRLSARSPSKFRALTDRLGLSNTSVFFQTDDIIAHASEINVSPETLVERLGGSPADFEAARGGNGRIAVKASGVVTSLVGDSADFIKSNASITAQGYTPEQAKQLKEVQDEIADQVALENDLEAMAPKRKDMYTQISSQLKATGRMTEPEVEANAALATAWFETMGTRYGTDAQDMFQRMGFDVVGEAQNLDDLATGQKELAAQTKEISSLEGLVSSLEGSVASAAPEVRAELEAQLQEAVAALEAAGVGIEELTAAVDAGIAQFQENQANQADPAVQDVVQENQTRGAGRGQGSDTGGRTRSGSLSALEGAPTVRGVSGPDPRLVAVAEQYAADNGIDLKRQAEFVQVDAEFATRVADAYAEMEHNPQDPVVKEAYDNLIQQTTAQYQALVDAGYQFYFIDLNTQEGQDYAASPWNAMFDARDNQIMGVFSTAEGFGTSEDFSADANPLLADTGIEWPLGPNGEMRPVYANDLFRAVHDAFGHGLEFTGFRANGEENAWQAHKRLFTGSAVAAITTETRGQNSWLNYGPNGEANRTASVDDTVFADQKTGLLPEFTWTENVSPDDVGEVRVFEQSGVELFDNPLDIEGKTTVKAIGQAMTDDHLSKDGRQLFPEDSEEDYQQVYANVAGELEAQLQQPNSGAGWYSKDVQDAINETAKAFPSIATPEGRATWLTFAGIFSNGLDPSQAWEISAEAFQYWDTFGEIPINRAEAARRLGNEVRMTSYKDKAGNKVNKAAGWGVRNPANEQQLTMFRNLVEREGSPKAAVDWMLSPQPREAINEIVLTAQNTPRFKTKAEREGPEQWGALMFSEKLGRYTMGLHGFQITEEDTTVDLWYTRTYRRLTGRLMEKPLGKEGIAAQPDPARGGIERKTIFRLTGDLGRQFGLDAGDVQAMLWFFEKRLWGAQGLRTDEGTNSAGARRLIEKRTAANDGAGSAAADQGVSGATGQVLNQQNRGQIALPSNLTDARSVITLFQKSDKSTFVHEAGHFFLQAFSELAASANAPADMVADMGTINTFLGREEGDQSPFTVDQQEQWAQSFEKYMETGKAPSVELRTSFERLRKWIVNVYRQFGSLNVELPQEVTEVMDRMLATDDQIAIAKADQGMGQMLTSKPANMTEEAWSAYRKGAVQHDDEAAATLLAKTMEPIRRARTKGYRERRDALRAEIAAEVDASPEQRTVRRLVTKDQARLDRKQILDIYGPEALADLDKHTDKGRKVYGTGEASIEATAHQYGYKNAATMISELRELPARDSRIEDELRMRLREEFADALDDGSIKREAMAALHKDKNRQLMVMDLNYILEQIKAEGGEVPTMMTKAELETRVADEVARTTVRTATQDQVYLREERKAARKAQTVMARIMKRTTSKGTLKTSAGEDLVAAFNAKEDQIIAHMKYNHAREAQAIVDRLVKANGQIRSKDVGKRMAEPQIGTLRSLMEKYSFRKRTPKQLRDERSLASYVQAMVDAGNEDQLSFDAESVIATGSVKHFSELTVEELQELDAIVKNLMHVGRATRKILDGINARAYEEVKRDIVLELDASHENNGPSKVGKMEGTLPRGAKAVRGFFLSMSNADNILRILDRAKRDTVGLLGRVVAIPVQDGMSRAQTRKRQNAEWFERDLWKSIYGKDYVKQLREFTSMKIETTVGDSKEIIDGYNLLTIALNTGADGNMERLTNPSSRNFMTKKEIERVLSEHMTDDMWKVVDKVWGKINELWPDISALEVQATGVKPQQIRTGIQVKVAPAFVKNGGYYPIRYDREQAIGTVRDTEADTQVKNMASGRAARAQTKNGWQKERTAVTGDPLSLQFHGALAHLNDVVYDLELRIPLSGAMKVLKDRDISAVLTEKGFNQEVEHLKLWAEDVANGDRTSQDAVSKLVKQLREGTSVAAMAYSWTTLVQQPLGLFNAVNIIGSGNMVKGFSAYMGNVRSASDVVMSKSPFMTERQQTMQRDMALASGAMREDTLSGGRVGAFKQGLQSYGFVGMQKLQFYTVDMPTWYAAYGAALQRNESEGEAISYADRIVARAHGSGVLSDRSAFERGTVGANTRNSELVRAFTTFQTFIIARLSVTSVEFRNLRMSDPATFMDLVSDLTIAYVMPSIFASLLLLRPWDEREQDEIEEMGIPMWWLKTQLPAEFIGGPIISQAMSAWEGYGAETSFESGISAVMGAGKAVSQLAQGEGSFDSAITSLVSGAGIVFKLPSVVLNRAIKRVLDEDGLSGEELNLLEILYGKGLTFAD